MTQIRSLCLTDFGFLNKSRLGYLRFGFGIYLVFVIWNLKSKNRVGFLADSGVMDWKKYRDSY